MCGIVGYVGKRSAQDVLLDGLESWSIAGTTPPVWRLRWTAASAW